MEIWQPGIGLAVSVVLGCVRYRWPMVSPQLASAGIGAGIGLAAVSITWPGWLMAVSVILNFALGAALVDQFISRTAKGASNNQSDAAAEADLVKQRRLAAKGARSGAPVLDAPSSRRLTEREKSAITRHAIGYEALRHAPKQLTVGRNNASRSAIRCAIDLAEAFQKANWQVHEMGGSGFTVFPPTGIGVAFHNYGELAPDQRSVKEALELAGIPFDIIAADNFMMARTTIFVTDPD